MRWSLMVCWLSMKEVSSTVRPTAVLGSDDDSPPDPFPAVVAGALLIFALSNFCSVVAVLIMRKTVP